MNVEVIEGDNEETAGVETILGPVRKSGSGVESESSRA